MVAFRGLRSRTFACSFLLSLARAEAGAGVGPTALDALLFVGHVGVSLDGGSTVYGFHPDGRGAPPWRVFTVLRTGRAFPGVVRDDTAVFAHMMRLAPSVESITIRMPEPHFLAFEKQLDAEYAGSQYGYGFPRGDGDCNCITWLERLGLPLLTGDVDEFGRLIVTARRVRRFGPCQ